MSLKRWLLAIASFAVAIGVSAYIVIASWPAEEASIVLPVTAHLLALAAVFVEIAARALKIKLSGAALGIPLTLGTCARTSVGGDFGAAITPARSGAEPARFLILAETGISVSNVLLLLFVELFLEMVSLAIVAVLLISLFQGTGTSVVGLVGLVGAYSAVVLGVGGIVFVLAQRNANGPAPRWADRLGLHAGRWRSVQRWLRQLRSSMLRLRDAHRGYSVMALMASVLHVAARLAVLPILVYSLDRSVSLAPLLLWPLALFYGGVVAPVPGGGGVIEVAFKATLGGVIPATIFGASLIWWRVYTFYLYVVLGALAAGRSVMRALREDRAKEGEEGEGEVGGVVADELEENVRAAGS